VKAQTAFLPPPPFPPLQAYSSYYPSLATVGVVLVLSTVVTCVGAAYFELPATRRAKRVEGGAS
jgi:hypothetical protein